MRGILHNRFLHFFYFTTPKRARNITSQTRERERKRCASRARRESLLARGIFGRINPLARRFCRQKQKKKKKKRRRELFKIRPTEIAGTDDDDDDDEKNKRARRANEGKNERGPRQRHSAANGTTTKSCCGKHCSIAPMPKTISRSNKNSFKPSSGLKGGWRSGRLNKGRFIVEKMKKKKRIDGTTSFLSSKDTTTVEEGDQNPTGTSSLFFDGSLLLSDENRDTITATCDGETLKMLLTQKKKTKKEKGRE